ncbi:hypothetical protein ACEN2F_03525 [Flavobacterium sp. W20_MBD1_R3]
MCKSSFFAAIEESFLWIQYVNALAICVRDRGGILEVQRRDKAESPTRSFYGGLRPKEE